MLGQENTFPKAGKAIRIKNWHVQKIAPIFLIFAKVGTIKFRYLKLVKKSLVLKCIKSIAETLHPTQPLFRRIPQRSLCNLALNWFPDN